MSHYNVKPLETTLSPSWQLAAWLLGLHVLVISVVLSVPFPWPQSVLIRMLLLLVLLASLAYHMLYQVVRRLAHSVIALKLAVDGTFSIRLKGSDWAVANILGSSFVHPHLTILNLSLKSRHFPVHVVLMPDMLDAEAFRRLRVWLKWGVKTLPD